ncbi:hypothetical protein [Rothia sp. ZJ1223]|uniref:hypothetical protein n=1 Tax=Rothia sp. ZJ1223 TaxID=2811098 RepID=UPI00195D8F52|nr:hypothetical protein [Rothia sp. ZJ1223]MBM7050958.1 hypothetical protein [Rothia sp. ZJ1223]
MKLVALTSDEIAQILHTVFDEQIINFGAYNLVLATGTSRYDNEDIATGQQEDQTYFLVGYRDAPRGIVVAPVTFPEIASGGTPTSVDNTNLVSLGIDPHEQLVIETTNGSSFALNFQALHSFESSHGTGTLDQTVDLEDFAEFLKQSTVLEQL